MMKGVEIVNFLIHLDSIESVTKKFDFQQVLYFH